MNSVKLMAMMKALKASTAANTTEKGSGPYKALNAIGIVAASNVKKRPFS